MDPKQTVFPFHANRSQRRKHSNVDLVGRVYMDDYVRVTVVGLCEDDNQYVLVRRQPGNTSPMLAWLMRSIFAEEDKKLRRAA
jgi:hypothetical protein